MFYVIYKITNLVNGKVYIGKHKTVNVDDRYMGSGKLLHRAIAKYGADNFVKEILHICSCEDDMNTKEREIVTEEFCLRDDTYNLCTGGNGGFSYINRTGLSVNTFENKLIARSASEAGNAARLQLFENNPELRTAWITKISKANKGKFGTFAGKSHSDQAKQKISRSKKGNATGADNSQFGTMWIYSDVEQKSCKINKTDDIPAGWKPGRKFKFNQPI